jgi:hypothetical protein
MKKIIYASFIASVLMITACGGTEAQKNTTAAEAKPAAKAETALLDLTPAGINATIEVPKDVKILDNKYDVTIGNGKDITILIEKTTESFSAIKAAVAANDIRGFVKFVQEDANGFIAEIKPLSSTEYDFYYFATIGGESYTLSNVRSEHHPELDPIKAMYGYAKTIKAK